MPTPSPCRTLLADWLAQAISSRPRRANRLMWVVRMGVPVHRWRRRQRPGPAMPRLRTHLDGHGRHLTDATHTGVEAAPSVSSMAYSLSGDRRNRDALRAASLGACVHICHLLSIDNGTKREHMPDPTFRPEGRWNLR